jgi:heat shock protein HtpX
MAGFVFFLTWLGVGGDLAAGTLQQGLPVGTGLVLLVGAIVTWRAWAKGPQRILWSTGARELTEPATTGERQLVNVVEEMAIASGVPRPRIFLVDDPDPNAFATGHGPQDAAVAATRGLIERLNREELQGVMAHEMAHVRNLDVRLMTTIAALVGYVVILSDVLGRGLRLGGGSSRSRSKGGGGPLLLVLLVLWLLTLILAPLIMRLMAMGVSRNREYLADAAAAQFTRNPAALASALEKIEGAAEPTRSIAKSAAHLCIADPLGRKVNEREGAWANLMGTHPPIRSRIIRLRGMAYQAQKAAVPQPPATA